MTPSPTPLASALARVGWSRRHLADLLRVPPQRIEVWAAGKNSRGHALSEPCPEEIVAYVNRAADAVGRLRVPRVGK